MGLCHQQNYRCCNLENISFKYILNKVGPKTDPCGTPFKRADQELKDLSIFVLC